MHPVRVSLPFGVLKIKASRHLRDNERRGMVPVRQIGSLYFVWYGKDRISFSDETGTGDQSTDKQAARRAVARPPRSRNAGRMIAEARILDAAVNGR